MPQVLAQPALQRVIQEGIQDIKSDITVLDEVFEYYTCPEMTTLYGQSYIDNIKIWFDETVIPVVQSWPLNPQRLPAISIHLATEQEDEGKAAIGDHYGIGDEGNIGVAVFTVMLDIGIHSSKNSDEVIWLYYIISYILFNKKRLAEKLGLQNQTFNASDYSKLNQYSPDNVWQRWIRFRCTVENFWEPKTHIEFDDVFTDVDVQSTVETGDDDIVSP